MMRPNLITSSESAVKYYAAYALAQGECEGKWTGKGADRLGLSHKAVTEADLRALLTGHDLNGQPLVKMGRNKDTQELKHTPGWDLTFSAPKDVSVIWSSADAALRESIERAQDRAVKNAIDQLQTYSARSRTGAGGRESIEAEIVAGLFQHSSNREKEPQLHTHAIITNLGHGTDGKWRTIDSRHFFKDQRAISAIYKASLAHEMRLLGFQVERTTDSFAIKGVPEAVKALQSSRSRALEDELAAQGLTRSTASKKLKESIVLQTRKSKGSHHHAEAARDFERWQTENSGVGFTGETIRDIRIPEKQIHISPVPSAELLKVSLRSMECITEERSVFERVHLHSEISESLIGKASYEEIKAAMQLAHGSDELKFLAKDSLSRDKLSTRSMMTIEKRVHDIVRSRASEGLHVVPQKNVEQTIQKRFPTIEPEQRAALEAAVLSRAGVTIIQGVAGAGKSFTMKAVRSVYEENSYRVQGLSPTNKAARELSRSTDGMTTSSIESFLYRLRNGTIQLSKKDVLIIDEAGMAGSKRFDVLMQKAKLAKAKVVLLGDAKQIQPIEAGQIFGEIHKRFGSEELRKVVRQTDKEEAAALLQLRDGSARQDFEKAVDYLESKGRHFMGADSEKTIRQLVSDVHRYQADHPGKDALVVASRNETVERINNLMREELKLSGAIQSPREFTLRKGRLFELGVNDRIVFTQNAKELGILNSELAVVSRIDGTVVTAVRSDKERVVFDLKTFQGLSHGYAVTAHKSQATTVDRAFVYADGPFLDKEKVYVAMTRGREGNRLYSDRASLGQLSYQQRKELRKLNPQEREKAIAFEYKGRLVAQISRSSEKDTTLRYRADAELNQALATERGLFMKLTARLSRGFTSGMSKTAAQKKDLSKAAVTEGQAVQVEASIDRDP